MRVTYLKLITGPSMAKKRIPLFLSIFIFLALVCPSVLPAGGLQVWELDGTQRGLVDSLSSSQWTLVMFWSRDCSTCRSQYPLISAFHTKHHEGKAVVLGVSLDGITELATVATYRENQGHTFPSVVADFKEFAAKYEQTMGRKFLGTPTYLFFDKARLLQAYVEGPVTAAAIDDLIAAP